MKGRERMSVRFSSSLPLGTVLRHSHPFCRIENGGKWNSDEIRTVRVHWGKHEA